MVPPDNIRRNLVQVSKDLVSVGCEGGQVQHSMSLGYSCPHPRIEDWEADLD